MAKRPDINRLQEETKKVVFFRFLFCTTHLFPRWRLACWLSNKQCTKKNRNGKRLSPATEVSSGIQQDLQLHRLNHRKLSKSNLLLKGCSVPFCLCELLLIVSKNSAPQQPVAFVSQVQGRSFYQPPGAARPASGKSTVSASSQSSAISSAPKVVAATPSRTVSFAAAGSGTDTSDLQDNTSGSLLTGFHFKTHINCFLVFRFI